MKGRVGHEGLQPGWGAPSWPRLPPLLTGHWSGPEVLRVQAGVGSVTLAGPGDGLGACGPEERPARSCLQPPALACTPVVTGSSLPNGALAPAVAQLAESPPLSYEQPQPGSLLLPALPSVWGPEPGSLPT